MSDYKKTNDLTEKTTPVDADLLRLDDSADSFAWKKATIANVSTKVQADLIANSTNYNALAILMKGYKEYTFAIRQSGTDAPVLYLIKDDFGVTPLVATYISAGRYTCDVTELGITTASNKCSIWVSKANPYDASDAHEVTAVLKTDTLFIVYSIVNNVLSDDVIGAAGSGECVTISIRETLS